MPLWVKTRKTERKHRRKIAQMGGNSGQGQIRKPSAWESYALGFSYEIGLVEVVDHAAVRRIDEVNAVIGVVVAIPAH